jgi:hypothetical protein
LETTGYEEDWRQWRADLDKRRESRRKQRRFRRNPANNLSEVEERCLQASLPAQKKRGHLPGEAGGGGRKH